MPRLGNNGGLMGLRRVPSSGSASGVWDSDEQSLAKRAGIWPVTGGDPYFANVSLLLHMDGSNGSTTFTDSSNNAVSVTANGNAQISTAQSKFSGSSGSFSAGHIITPAGSLFNFGTGDFCIEFWCYFNSVASGQRLGGGDLQSSSGGFNWAIFTTSSGQLDYYLGTGGVSWDIGDTKSIGAVSTGQWYHVALVRNGNTFNGYLDGVSGSSTTSSASIGANSTNGAFFGAQATSNFNGYLDDIRITKGVARYTANFTPPTAPFPDF